MGDGLKRAFAATKAPMKPTAHVVWGVTSGHGYVYFRGGELYDSQVTSILRAALDRIQSQLPEHAKPWATMNLATMTSIDIRQPTPRWLGGAAEREHANKEVRRTRDVLKSVLREKGFSVR